MGPLAKVNTPLFHSFVLHIGKHPYHYSIKGTQITRFVRKVQWLIEPL